MHLAPNRWRFDSRRRLDRDRLFFAMDENPYDPEALARRQYRESLWLCSLLTKRLFQDIGRE